MLFDDVQRSDPSPATHSESSFEFLNRVSGTSWEQVRDRLEEWYAAYPDDSRDVRNRFREPDLSQHFGAWWELYIYTLYRHLGYRVTVHPPIPGTLSTPDFLIERDGASMYVECVVFFSGGGTGKRTQGVRAHIYDSINAVKNPNFVVDLDIAKTGRDRPRRKDITKPLARWLSSLDPDVTLKQMEAGVQRPNLMITAAGWELSINALPLDPEHRTGEGRLLGVYPVTELFIVKDIERIRNTLGKKGSHYRQPDKPLVVAVLNTSGFIDEVDITAAVFGDTAFNYFADPKSFKLIRQRNGYWRPPDSSRGKRVSAVLLGQYLHPWNVANTLPKVWVNPWAQHSYPEGEPPFALTTVNDSGHVFEQDAGITPQDIFQLDPDWPHYSGSPWGES